MRSTTSWVTLLVLACPAAAAAQDFGSGWMDRVTHHLIEDDAPLSTLPLHLSATGGEIFAYDSNIFLTDTDRRADSIFTTFAQGALRYSQPEWDAAADLGLNYNAYVHHNDSSADEERFFGRVRYQGSRISASLAEVLRRESSPTDVVFHDRVPRTISDTTPQIIVHATDVLSFELESNLQYVRFNRTGFESADNTNTRTALTLAYKSGWHDLTLLAQGGYLTINYKESTSTDAAGYYGRAGGRGEILEGLHVVFLAGITSAKSDDFTGTTTNAEHSTMDVETHLAYTLSERSMAYADYSRRIGFAAGGVPFQVIDSAGLSGDIALRDDLKLRGRLQYDRVHGPYVETRGYYAASVGAEYRFHEHVVVDGGVSYRAGVALEPGGGGDFRDVIVSIGVAVAFD